MAEYTVNLPLGPLEVGTRVDRRAWPLHLTLVPNVRTDVGLDRVVAVFREAAATLAPLTTVVGEEAWFDPGGSVLVDRVDPTGLRDAHDALATGLLEHADAVPVTDRYFGDGWQPHVTTTSTGRVQRGKALRLGRVVLAEIAPGGNEHLAVVVAAVDLGAPPPPQAMSAAAAADLLVALDAGGVRAWAVGGWGVDALVGEQTRVHHDLDVLVRADDLPALHEALPRLGLAVRSLWSENRSVEVAGALLPSAFVADGPAGELDVHAIRFEGDRPVAVSASTVRLPPGALDGDGRIEGRRVRCATAAAQLVMHEGYELPERQVGDLDRLRALM